MLYLSKKKIFQLHLNTAFKPSDVITKNGTHQFFKLLLIPRTNTNCVPLRNELLINQDLPFQLMLPTCYISAGT